MPSKKPSKRQQAQTKSQIKKLRDAGLISKRVKLSAKPSRSTQSAIRKFGDFLKGKASVVDVPKNVAKHLKSSHRVVGSKVIIERQKGERLRYDKESEKIVGTRRVGKRTFTRTIERDLSGAKPPRAGSRRYYVVPFQRSGGDIDYLKFDDLSELENFMHEYEKSGYKNWKNYIEIVDVSDNDELEEMKEEFPSLDTYQYKVRKKKKRNNRPTVFRKPK